MSVLAALAKAYERLPDIARPGYSAEKIGFLISLNDDGTLAGLPIDLRVQQDKKLVARVATVPQPVKRTAGIAPNFLWDKTAYVLGVTNGEGRRTAEEHAAFVARHHKALDGNEDAGLKALLAFLDWWTPEQFEARGWPAELRDENVVFALESDRLSGEYLHQRPAAQALWASLAAEGDKPQAICLVTGNMAPVARLHPSIKGVWGGQTAGASIVSFNLDAFTSYGHDQGANAPVSEAAAFAYTTALNHFLATGSKNRIQIGDTSTVFWADASDDNTSEVAEGVFAAIFGGVPIDESGQAERVGAVLERMRQGTPIADFDPHLATGVRFYVLGLAPNAARISIRFWFEDTFGVLAQHYAKYVQDTAFEPWPASRKLPSIASYVLRTAPARRDQADRVSFDRDRTSSLLAGELLRAILSGARLPNSLLPLLLLRVRGDHLLDSLRISLIKGLVVRTMRVENRLPKRADGTMMEDYLVRSDPDDPNPARRLGRLFAIIERTQLAALGDDINATVKDKFIGAAAATPEQVFVGILKNAQNHLKRLRNGHSDASWIKDAAQARRVGAGLDRDIGRLWGSFDNGVPAQHSSEEQGLFLVGYYQERYGNSTGPEATAEADSETTSITEGEE